MGFRATSLSITTVLLVCFASVVIYILARRKADSNLPMIFYLFLFIYTRFVQDSVNANLFFAGVVLALFLRFEFMNRFFTLLVLLLEMCSILLIVWELLGEILGPQFAPF